MSQHGSYVFSSVEAGCDHNNKPHATSITRDIIVNKQTLLQCVLPSEKQTLNYTLAECWRNGTKTEIIQQTTNMKIFAPCVIFSIKRLLCRQCCVALRNILTSCQAQITASGPGAVVTNGIACCRDIGVRRTQ